ncbi:MAG: hypothetical protein ACRC5T_11150 [Cetobacterium sp.]
MPNKCTVPKLLGFNHWFQSRFGDLCEQHDLAYLTRKWQLKQIADYEISGEIIKQGYFALGCACFVYCQIFGTILWLWKK